jgi:hypothetical protein
MNTSNLHNEIAVTNGKQRLKLSEEMSSAHIFAAHHEYSHDHCKIWLLFGFSISTWMMMIDDYYYYYYYYYYNYNDLALSF